MLTVVAQGDQDGKVATACMEKFVELPNFVYLTKHKFNSVLIYMVPIHIRRCLMTPYRAGLR